MRDRFFSVRESGCEGFTYGRIEYARSYRSWLFEMFRRAGILNEE